MIELVEEKKIEFKDCATCVYDSRYGCRSWDCKYLNLDEAIRIVEEAKKVEGTQSGND